MASTSEVGHLKNITNFDNLLSFCEGFGSVYNPAKESLKIPQLQSFHQLAKDHFTGAKIQKTAFDIATNSRRNGFADLKTFATRVLNAFSVSGADALAVADAKAINKKIQGTSSKKSAVDETNEENTESIKSISNSQQSYDRLIDHFANLIEVVSQSNIYNPNEPDLQLASLETKLDDLQTLNSKLTDSYTDYSNALILRNKTLYDPLTGLVQTSKEVKRYLKSIFGASSPQYKQISRIEFKVIKKE